MAPVVLKSFATKGIVGVNVPVTKTVHKRCLTSSKGIQKEYEELTWDHPVTRYHCQYSVLSARGETLIV